MVSIFVSIFWLQFRVNITSFLHIICRGIGVNSVNEKLFKESVIHRPIYGNDFSLKEGFFPSMKSDSQSVSRCPIYVTDGHINQPYKRV